MTTKDIDQMSEYRVTRKGYKYEVAHYCSGDPNPTPTQSMHDYLPEAFQEALGRAAQQSIILKTPIRVVTEEKVYAVTATQVPK